MNLKIPDTITEEEMLKIVKATKQPRTKSAYKIAFYQCLRVSEVLNLLPEHIDKEGGWIHVKKGKGNKDRDIPIMKPALSSLNNLPIKLTRQALHKSIKAKGKKVLQKDIHFHTLRHSGASMYLTEKDVNIKFIQQLLGHSRLATTEIYLHVNPKQLKKGFQNVWK